VERVRAPANYLCHAYLKALEDYSILTAEEEKRLAVRTHQGDLKARERLVRCNLKLVLAIAQQYFGKGISLPDAIQEGHIGLLLAVDRYDPARGYRFATYAGWWIKSTIQRAIINTTRTIRVPVTTAVMFNKYQRVLNELQTKLGRNPSEEETAQEMGLDDVGLISRLRSIGRVTASLGDPGKGDQVNILSTEVFDPERVERVEVVTRLLTLLDARRRYIVVRRFGLEGEDQATLRDIGQSLGISYERVRQMQEQALEELRQKAQTILGFHHG